MEEGSLRCDANISVRPRGQKEFGTKTEVKNVNSFRFIREALEYEIERHIGVVDSGGKITQETRLYNSNEGKTYGMRSKEQAHDYRYFPEPDLLPLVVDETDRIVWVAGFGIDEAFRVTDPAQAVLILKLKALGGSD